MVLAKENFEVSMWQRCVFSLCFVPICLSAESAHPSGQEKVKQEKAAGGSISCNASPQSAKEAFCVRQFLDSLEAKDTTLQEQHLATFLENFPESTLADPVQFLIGEQALREERYDAAKQAYQSLTTQEWQEHARKSYMYAAYKTQDWTTLFALEPAALQEMQQEELALTAEGYLKGYLASSQEEESLAMARQAIARYRLLLASPYHKTAALALARLCPVTQEFRQAAKAYALLAQADPTNASFYLFQQACMTAHFDRALALDRFYDLAATPGPMGDLALLEWTALAYRSGYAEELVAEKNSLLARIPQENRSELHLCFGNSYLALQEWESACDELIEYLYSTPKPDAMAKTALLSIMEGARQEQLWTLIEVAYTHLEEAFPDDAILSQARLVRSQARAAQTASTPEDS